MSINWTKRLVIASLTTSLSGVGIASAQSWGDRDGANNNRDRNGQLQDRTRGEKTESVTFENVGYGRDRDHGDRWGRDHGRHRGWNKRKHRRNHHHRWDNHRRGHDRRGHGRG